MNFTKNTAGPSGLASATSAGDGKAGKAHVALLIAAATVFFVLYLFSGVDVLAGPHAKEFRAYPFGSDVPTYAFGEGISARHPLMTWVLKGYHAVTAMLGIHDTVYVIDFPYALFGALNVVVCAAAFSVLFGKLTIRTILYGMCCGLAMAVWFYASMPESWGLTTLLYSLYILILLKMIVDKPTDLLGGLLALVFFLALYNEITAATLLVLPFAFFGMRILREPVLRRVAVYSMIAGAIYLGIHISETYFVEWYSKSFIRYSPITGILKGEAQDWGLVFMQPMHDMLVFAVGAPTADPNFVARPLTSPGYMGYFEPNLLTFFGSLSSFFFLAMYAVVISFVRLRHVNRLVIGLGLFVLARLGLGEIYNPTESILYSSVSVLALFMIWFYFVEKSDFRYKTALVLVFAVSLFATNWKFFA